MLGCFGVNFDELRNARHNGTPWCKNPCVTNALGAGVLSVGIDAIGLIPETRGISSMIGRGAEYVGGIASGAEIVVDGVKTGMSIAKSN